MIDPERDGLWAWHDCWRYNLSLCQFGRIESIRQRGSFSRDLLLFYPSTRMPVTNPYPLSFLRTTRPHSERSPRYLVGALNRESESRGHNRQDLDKRFATFSPPPHPCLISYGDGIYTVTPTRTHKNPSGSKSELRNGRPPSTRCHEITNTK